jgi:hypothetical protein
VLGFSALMTLAICELPSVSSPGPVPVQQAAGSSAMSTGNGIGQLWRSPQQRRRRRDEEELLVLMG